MKMPLLAVALLFLGFTGACAEEAELAPAASPQADLTESEEQAKPSNGAETDSPEPPANWTKASTSGVPTSLAIYASKAEKNGGSVHPVTIKYRNESGTYGCELSSGVPKGEWRSCTPTQSSTETSSNMDYFYVGFSTSADTDGLLVGNVKAVVGGSSYSLDEFYSSDKDNDVFCHYTSGYNTCGSFWVDGDDSHNTNCTNVKIPMFKSEGSTEDHRVACVD